MCVAMFGRNAVTCSLGCLHGTEAHREDGHPTARLMEDSDPNLWSEPTTIFHPLGALQRRQRGTSGGRYIYIYIYKGTLLDVWSLAQFKEERLGISREAVVAKGLGLWRHW